jgi:YD repeat-containing protein
MTATMIDTVDAAGTNAPYWIASRYDGLGRPTQEIDPFGRTRTLAYDCEGHTACITLGDYTRSYTYNTKGQLATTTTANGTSGFFYDANGALAGTLTPNGTILDLDGLPINFGVLVSHQE